MGYRLLADATVVVHFAFLAYVVTGGLLAWRWRWAIWPHLAAAGWGLAVTVGHLNCPLTFVENWARQRAGESTLAGGFIDHYVTGVVYPARYAGLMQILVGLVVVLSWAGAARVRWRGTRVSGNPAP
jgi:Protein of Unknown function (DUF2784)